MAGNEQNSQASKTLLDVKKVSTTPPPELECPVFENCCYTHVKVVKFSYKWTIAKFSCRTEKIAEVLKSPTFSAGTKDKFEWRLRVYPHGKNEESKDYVSLYLNLVQSPNPEVWVNYKFSILNANREEKEILQLKRARNFVQGESWGYWDFVKHDFLRKEVNGLLPDDKLTILCEGSVIGETVHHPGQSGCSPVKVPETQLIDDMGNMLDRASFTDVTLYAQGKEFKAHKAILAARSSVFSAMFEHPLEENALNRVNISDIDHEVLTEMLRFMYTGKVSNLDTMAVDLLAAADKYQLERLKVMCEESLCTHLSVDNVSEVLVHADLHSASQLKQHAIDFINGHVSYVMDTQGWKTMVTNQPHIIRDAFSALASQQSTPVGPPRKRIKQK